MNTFGFVAEFSPLPNPPRQGEGATLLVGRRGHAIGSPSVGGGGATLTPSPLTGEGRGGGENYEHIRIRC